MRRREEGVVAVVTALVLVVMMGAVALTVDVGGMLYRRREMVNGADAAALAAALKCSKGLGAPAAQADALAIFPVNAPHAAGFTWTMNLSQCNNVTGSVSVTFTSTQPLYFAPVLGLSNSRTVTVAATGSWRLNGLTPAVLHPVNGADKQVYVCKYVGNPERLSVSASGWRSVNSSDLKDWHSGLPWNGTTGFNDAQDSFVIASVPQSNQSYFIDPAVDCPHDASPHVWLSA
jgi:Flp pilus assembly protein TadG